MSIDTRSTFYATAPVVIGIDADSQCLAYAVLRGGVAVLVETISRANPAGLLDSRYDQRLTALLRRVGELGGMVYLAGIYLADGGRRGRRRNRQRWLSLTT